MRYAYTAEGLAAHWGVSAATVRNLVRGGELRAFRVGRQIRIRPEAAEEYERCKETGTGASSSTGANTTPSGQTGGAPSAKPFGPTILPLRASG
ncbi:MAG: helix-turn-helix domain-containing protein [Caulobacteraceae bacterium]|nr:helix-turn-helix domain-containing protein [Caulobacteraceae bacterium]